MRFVLWILEDFYFCNLPSKELSQTRSLNNSKDSKHKKKGNFESTYYNKIPYQLH